MPTPRVRPAHIRSVPASLITQAIEIAVVAQVELLNIPRDVVRECLDDDRRPDGDEPIGEIRFRGRSGNKATGRLFDHSGPRHETVSALRSGDRGVTFSVLPVATSIM